MTLASQGEQDLGSRRAAGHPLELFSGKKSPGSCVMSAAQQPTLPCCPSAHREERSLQAQDQLALAHAVQCLVLDLELKTKGRRHILHMQLLRLFVY